MQNVKLIISLIAATIGVISYIPYIVGTIKGNLKPSAATWMVWGVLTVIALAGQLSGGGGIGTLTTGVSAVASFVVMALALRDKKNRKFSRMDWGCLAFSLLAICLWPVAHSALLSEELVTGVTLVGFVPTLYKSYGRPTEEGATMYLIGILKFSLACTALSSFSATTLIYPISCATANAVLVSLLIVRRRQLGLLSRPQGAYSPS